MRIHLIRNETLLDYSQNSLTHVPPAPNNMTVTEINLKINAIEEIRRNDFRTYNDLAAIYLDRNGLQVIHDGVYDHITTLRLLSVQHNNIIKLPTDFGPSTARLCKFLLTKAVADPRILTHPYFGAFTDLGSRTLHDCNIANVSNSFLPPNIHLLLLGIGKVEKFPNLSSSPSLSYVAMGQQKFSTIPQEAIAGLLKLRTLKLGNNEISNFPNFSHCKRPRKIYLAENRISHIPREHIKGLDRIILMRLDYNLMANMTDISNLATMEEFTIGHNNISKFPSEYLMGLPNMKIIKCNNNNIHVLPNISRYFPYLRSSVWNATIWKHCLICMICHPCPYWQLRKTCMLVTSPYAVCGCCHGWNLTWRFSRTPLFVSSPLLPLTQNLSVSSLPTWNVIWVSS